MKIPALDWIIEYLEGNDVPYLVCGGLAAQAYGSTRDLADIDIYVPDEYLSQIVGMGEKYVTYGPVHHMGDKWDLTYVQFDFQNRKVEIGSDKECKIFDTKKGRWHEKTIDFSRYEYRSIYGQRFRVMNKQDLISYKEKLNRDVDIEDIRKIQKNV